MVSSEVMVGDISAKLHNLDALAFLKSLPDASLDLVFTSPPYCIGKSYDRTFTSKDFEKEHTRILKTLIRKVKPGGSICWQVGFHCKNGELVPLDAIVFVASLKHPEIKLRNRIVWTFAHGTHAQKRFSGRYETILWFTKGDLPFFDLDAARIPQKYPGKRHYKGPRRGEWSGNPLGKNPGDVWEIPNVKARHPEKTEHPCQFPTALVRRFIKALTKPGQLIADPYFGSGSTAVAALLEGRNFVGSDLEATYMAIAKDRLMDLRSGTPRVRDDSPPKDPNVSTAVAQRPAHFWQEVQEVDL